MSLIVLILSYLLSIIINYGLLLWEITSNCHKLEILQKKVLRFMTNISYSAHTAPLFIQHGVLRVTGRSMYKLLKYYYKLLCNLLPPCFDNYSETLEQKPIHDRI